MPARLKPAPGCKHVTELVGLAWGQLGERVEEPHRSLLPSIRTHLQSKGLCGERAWKAMALPTITLIPLLLLQPEFWRWKPPNKHLHNPVFILTQGLSLSQQSPKTRQPHILEIQRMQNSPQQTMGCRFPRSGTPSFQRKRFSYFLFCINQESL